MSTRTHTCCRSCIRPGARAYRRSTAFFVLSMADGSCSPTIGYDSLGTRSTRSERAIGVIKTRTMDTFLQDLRHAWRMARRTRAFTLAALAALALGIGANTAIFSVVNAVLLRPLPYPDPDRLVMFLNTSPQGSGPGASPTKFTIWRRQTTVVQDISAYRFSVVNLTEGDSEQIATAHVSADFFRLLGAAVAVGRTFSPAEDLPGGGRVAVLSEGFWRRRFGSDPALVGRTISLNGEPHEAIGVLGPFG